MSVNEKVFYARCITMNRYKFSYGRKPKGNRLKSLVLPSLPPPWVLDVAPGCLWGNAGRLKSISLATQTVGIAIPNEMVRVQDIFEVRNGHSLELNRLQLMPRQEGGIPFVSRKMGDNGVAAYVAPISDVTPSPGGELSCALSGNGVLSTFYQENPFYTAFHVACLRPLYEMSLDELLYYCSCIWRNRFRFSYGRQANRTIRDLLIPSRESVPFWVNRAISRVVDDLVT